MEKNAKVIKEHIEELYASTGKKVVLLGHSKGGVDASAACSMYWPQLRDKVVGCILVQSPYAGTPIASDILREGQIAEFETRRIMEILICKIIKVSSCVAVEIQIQILHVINNDKTMLCFSTFLSPEKSLKYLMVANALEHDLTTLGK